MVIMRGGGWGSNFHFIVSVGSSILFLLLSSCLTPPGVVARQKSCAQAQYLVMVAVLPCRRHARQLDFD